MPGISNDIVDAYVFRRNRGHAEFLLLKRRSDGQLGGTWHAVHGRIEPDESTVEAARRAVRMQTGLDQLAAYSADYINQFYDHLTDTIVLAPVLAFEVRTGSPITLAPEFEDYAWCDREEATGRLAFASQRWAVRHIDDIIAQPAADAEIYRIP
ncbi:MAG: NUDIX domain-containing protein [Thermomicrobiales bacterium]|nr:NUDIX domain-containing protein [Thermomicrobiales bacterium]